MATNFDKTLEEVEKYIAKLIDNPERYSEQDKDRLALEIGEIINSLDKCDCNAQQIYNQLRRAQMLLRIDLTCNLLGAAYPVDSGDGHSGPRSRFEGR
jgi:hypothetical protein